MPTPCSCSYVYFWTTASGNKERFQKSCLSASILTNNNSKAANVVQVDIGKATEVFYME